MAKHGSFLHNQYTTIAYGKTFHASWWFRGKSHIIPSSHLNDHIWMVSTLHSGYLKNNRIRQYNLCYISFSANWMSKKDWFIYPDPKYDIILPWNCHAYWPHQTYTYRSYNHACFSDFFRCNLEGFLFWAKVLDTSFPQIKTGPKRGWRYQEKSNKGRELWFFSSPPQQQNTGGKTFSHIGISLLSMKQGGFVVHFVRCCLSWDSKPTSAKVQIHLPLALVSPGTKTGVWMDWVTHHKTREKSNNKMSTDSKKPSPHSPKNILEMDPKFSNGFSKTVAIWKPLPSESQDNHCTFSDFLFFCILLLLFWVVVFDSTSWQTSQKHVAFVCTNFINFIHRSNMSPTANLQDGV